MTSRFPEADRARIHDILADFVPLAKQMGPEMVTYLNYHRERFVFLGAYVGELLGKLPSSPKRVLDVGPSFQTLLFQHLWPEVTIDTFGFFDAKFPPVNRQEHITFDLNDTYYPERWPKVTERYHIITMCEVIEHLYTSPVQVLQCLASYLRPGGYLLVQTPNAAALNSRLRLLVGRHPYEPIRQTRDNPGHYRESTGKELIEFGDAAGLRTVEMITATYSSSGSILSRIYAVTSRAMPKGLRKALVILFQKPE